MSSPYVDPAPPPPPPPSVRRLTRSRQDRVIGGVAGGLARHLSVDPVLVRLAFVALAVVGGGGVLIYLVAWIVIPEEPLSAVGADPAGPDAGTHPPSADRQGTGGVTPAVLGTVLIVLGSLLVIDRIVDLTLWRYAGPLLLVALGFALLARGRPS